MALLKEQIQEILKNPPQRSQLTRAIRNEQRLRFHAEESLSREEASPYLYDFDNWVARILPADKFKMFQTIMEFPLYSNELIKAIAEEYQKVYDSQNSSFTYEFSNENAESDLKAYLNDIDFWQDWKENSSEAMLKAINSILIIDMPEAGEETKPYYYFQSIDSVIDVAINKDGLIKYLIIEQGDELFVIDELRYSVYNARDKRNLIELLSVPHPLGYCPATFFWSETVKRKEPLIKRSPLTPALNNLNWLLYFETARRCLETYAAYPVDITFKENCSYFFEEGGESYHCVGGIINLPSGSIMECPVCSKSKFVGPGTLFRVPTPRSKDDPNLLDAFKRIPADTPSLDYCQSRSTELWEEIFYDCVGSDTSVIDNQAINKDQVRAHFASQDNIINNLKVNLEIAHTFLIDTMARLRYGTAYISCSINYGTEFYSKTTGEAVQEYKDSKLAGVPQYFLNYKRGIIDNISTKGNDSDAERLTILKNIEPFIDLSLNECKGLGLDTSNREQFLLKADFSRLILKFESEYGSIIEFGRLIDYKTKIDRIYQKLIDYVRKEFGGNIQNTIDAAIAAQTGQAQKAAIR